MGFEVGELWEWNFVWRRMMPEREMELVASFMEDIKELGVQPNQQDK